MSRKVHVEAYKSGSRKGLTIAKEPLFRAGVTMGEQRDGMRTRTRRKELTRRNVPGDGHRLDMDPWLDPV
jgi:hypothetical protein